MGGLVNFVTVQPDDLLGKDKRIAGRVAAGYDGSDNGRKLGATVAGRASPEWAWLLSAGLGRSHALGDMGTNNVTGAGGTKIGRASCRGKGEISVGGGSFKKKKKSSIGGSSN